MGTSRDDCDLNAKQAPDYNHVIHLIVLLHPRRVDSRTPWLAFSLVTPGSGDARRPLLRALMADRRSFGSLPCRSLQNRTPLRSLGCPCADLGTMRGALKVVRAFRSAHGQLKAQPAAASRSLFPQTKPRAPHGHSWAGSSRCQSTSRALAHSSWWWDPAPEPPRDVSAGGRPRKQPLVDAPSDTAADGTAASQAGNGALDAAETTAAAPKAVRKRRTRKVAAAAEPDAPAGPPPLDLGACVPPAETAAAWASVKQWVVFSDLHVSAKTVGVAVEVLRAVHAEAIRRDAGILFLGAPRALNPRVSRRRHPCHAAGKP